MLPLSKFIVLQIGHDPFTISTVSPCLHVLQYFTIKMQDGVVATSYANGDKFYIDPMKLLPLDRFLPKPKGSSAGITKGEITSVVFFPTQACLVAS